jgi:hypothetical protein
MTKQQQQQQQQGIKTTAAPDHQDMLTSRPYLRTASQSELFARNNNHNVRDPYQTDLEFVLQTLDEVERILEIGTVNGDRIGGRLFQGPNTNTHSNSNISSSSNSSSSSNDTEELWSQRELPSKQ